MPTGRAAVAVRFAAGLALLLLLVACPTTPPVTSVEVEEDDVALVLGESIEIYAVVVAQPGSAGILWASLDPDVVSVTAVGDAVALLTAEGLGSTTVRAISVADPAFSDEVTVEVREPGELLRTWQFGSEVYDEPYAVAVDGSGHVIVAGTSFGTIGDTRVGGYDAFVRKHTSSGDVVWTRQFGSPHLDVADGLAVDADGNVFVTGGTEDSQFSEPGTGDRDAFVSKFGADGAPLWTRRLATAYVDYGVAAAADDDGSVIVVGTTFGVLGDASAGMADVFVTKYDADGGHQWTEQFGSTQGDYVLGVALDAAGDVYVAGRTNGVLPGNTGSADDAYVGRLDRDGEVVWLRQFGTPAEDTAFEVVVDGSGNVIAAGRTTGVLPGAAAQGDEDMFVVVFDGDGDLIDTWQFGTADRDGASGVALDASGNVIVAGWTEGAFPGAVSAGGGDAVVLKLAGDGSVIWTRQFGTPESDYAADVAVGPDGEVVATGSTEGDLAGANQGDRDVFVRLYGR